MRLYSILYILNFYNINISGSRTIKIIIKGEINLIKKKKKVKKIKELRAAIINLNNS
jgi:hypothetical protein